MDEPTSHSPPPPPPRPRRPTRQIPPLPILITTSDEPSAGDSNTVHLSDRTETAVEPRKQETPIKQSQEPSGLTPIRAHYLKKALVQLQFRQEIDLITTQTLNNT
ncbi:hypothetical protein H0H93_015610, partial [Arthromyces matolae]